MTTYCVALSKGGSTKTTTAAELVAGLARRGRRVLAIDLDQQGNLTMRMGVTPDTEVAGVTADVLTAEVTAREAAIPAPTVPGAQIIAGTNDLIEIDTTLVPDLVTGLRDHLASDGHHWDDIVIDTPPSLAPLTLAGLAAADVVVVSMACEVESFDQIARLEEVIERKISRRIRPGLHISWIVPTRYNGHRTLDKEILEMAQERHPGKVTAAVREGVAVKDAYTCGMPVSVYAPQSNPALDYQVALAPVLAASTGHPATAGASVGE
ncbi:ParA family protein [Intrasporangium sp.]|uniref:ParA family protein n=1 Tax=Intrasporangium sp. TaxID=1925024 RepID=UPI003221977C